MRYRSLVGTMMIVGGLAAYAGAIGFAAERIGAMGWLVQAGFYALAGTVWVVPAAYLTRWMQRPAVSGASSGRAGSSAPRSDRFP